MIYTNISFDEECYQYLQEQSQQTGKTISCLLQEIIHNQMNRDVQKILKAVNGIYGLWQDRQIDVETYVRDCRKDRFSYGYD